MQPVYFASALIALLAAIPAASAETGPAQDLALCPGSQSEPARSATWGVAFCNRTGHDIVIQFHENDCPAENWAHRGDVYEETMRAGETKTFFLCYANEAQPAAPGIPQLRIPGGKGVVTTWSVVGDCGERSNRSRLDARSFYDRGEYTTGIVLLQHPSGGAHCAGDAGAASTATSATLSSSGAAAPPRSGATVPSGSGAVSEPSFHAVIDSTDRLTRTVKVFATSAPAAAGTHCRFMLALSFSDGTTWNDRVQTIVQPAADNSLVATRKYGKSVTRVDLGAARCAAP